MEIEKLIEDKWPLLKESEYCKDYGAMKFIGDEAFLHWIFKPYKTEVFVNELTRVLCAQVHPDYLNFIKQYNGIGLYCRSISIFGFSTCNEQTPFDFFINNYNSHTQCKNEGHDDDDIVFVGGLGGYLLCYKKTALVFPETANFFLVDHKKSLKPLQKFKSIEHFITYYATRLKDEYTEEGKRLHPNTKYFAPISQNMFSELIFDKNESV